jgi:hypothetical protein
LADNFQLLLAAIRACLHDQFLVRINHCSIVVSAFLTCTSVISQADCFHTIHLRLNLFHSCNIV